MNLQVDLTNCDREPIHVPGSVQPFGFLLALVSDFSIVIASDSAIALNPIIIEYGNGHGCDAS